MYSVPKILASVQNFFLWQLMNPIDWHASLPLEQRKSYIDLLFGKFEQLAVLDQRDIAGASSYHAISSP